MHDTTDPETPRDPPVAGNPPGGDVDPATAVVEEEDETLLPEAQEEAAEAVAEGTLASGRSAIARAVRLAPASAGVYRMLNAAGDVLYVGKAKSVRKRLASYARPTGNAIRIARMIAATANVEIVSTATETEALLLEANLIKQLRPRFNVQLRDDKSFPYILMTGDHWAPQILKHRGAQTRPGNYFGPFASAGAVGRTITALQRAFLIRSCTDAFFESRTRPCLLYQIKRCSGPCTREIDFTGYSELVREAKDFLSGRSRAVKELLAREMEQASTDLEFERAALYRDRLAALSAVQAQQGINPRTLEEADVFAIHQEGGYSCVEVFFFRTGQNWGNRAYFPRADRSFSAAEVLGSFLPQFYEDKPAPRLVLLSHEIDERELLSEALTAKAGVKVEVSVPQRGEKRELVNHALANAREALGRKLAELIVADAAAAGACDHARPAARAEAGRGLRQQPYPGHQRGRRDDRRRHRGLHQEPVPQVQHPLRGADARRRLRHDARGAGAPLQAPAQRCAARAGRGAGKSDSAGGGRRVGE